jgi:hypothetical protein
VNWRDLWRVETGAWPLVFWWNDTGQRRELPPITGTVSRPEGFGVLPPARYGFGEAQELWYQPFVLKFGLVWFLRAPGLCKTGHEKNDSNHPDTD